MALFPEIVAGYEAARSILADSGVDLTVPGARSIPTDPIGLINSAPAAYSVSGYVLCEGVNLCWNGRFGFDKDWQLVTYPVPYTDPAFQEKLAEVLLPTVEDFKQRAQAEKLRDYAQDAPGSVYEARDAIREVK